MPNDWIKTASGKAFDFLDPDPESIVLADICYALSYTYRFAGQSNPYSVASHSIAVGDFLKDRFGVEASLWGYLHDASEAYLCDMPAPIKKHLPNYQRIEQRIQFDINEKFLGRYTPEDPEILHAVKIADRRALAAEVPLFHTAECDREWIIDIMPMPSGYIRKGRRDPTTEGLALYGRILRTLGERQ